MPLVSLGDIVGEKAEKRLLLKEGASREGRLNLTVEVKEFSSRWSDTVLLMVILSLMLVLILSCGCLL